MLELKDLNIGYVVNGRVQVVLQNLNVNLSASSLIALAGNNGTGKSTLLKTIVGILKPLSGQILVEGKNSDSYSSADLAKVVSVVLTDKIGGFNLTVKDIVASGRIPYLNSFGNLTDKDEAIVSDSLETVGINNLRDKLFDELSDGQKQKALIAKSLAQQTPIILMDEPTAFLDYESRVSLFRLLKKLAKEQGKLIVISSHELDILLKNADKVLYTYQDGSCKFDLPEVIRGELRL